MIWTYLRSKERSVTPVSLDNECAKRATPGSSKAVYLVKVIFILYM
jgi:hypothetical protein